ncbi:MAG: hypothetical protein D6679_03475 [Candidatus Hydrogenedentota bacterium]|nr:MAG: hypothetical protein D6679_03475 [Candidatus Hydrogenedentota bacterium]
MELLELYRTAAGIRSETELPEFFDAVTRFCVERHPVRCAAVFLTDYPMRKLHCRSVCFSETGHEPPRRSFDFDSSVEGWVVENVGNRGRKPLIINTPAQHPLFGGRSLEKIRNILVLPMLDPLDSSTGIAAGTLTLLDHETSFSMETAEELDEIALLLETTLHHARLGSHLRDTQINLREILLRKTEEIEELHAALRRRHKEHLDDLRLAARIHHLFFSQSITRLGSFHVATRFRPSRHLAGDCIHVFRLGARFLGMIILDVSGFGISSCLLATFARETFHRAMLRHPNIRSAMTAAATSIRPVLPDHMFLTALIGTLNPATLKIEFCLAGHPPPVHIHRGRARELPVSGNAIGSGYPPDFGLSEVLLEPGDRFLAYTDGVVEIASSDNINFGHQRLLDLLEKRADLSLEELANLILRAGDIYAGTAETADDRGLILLEHRADS